MKWIAAFAALASSPACCSTAQAAIATAAPMPALSTLQLSASSVCGGEQTTARVTLTAPAPRSGVPISLVSSNASAASAAVASVTVPAGAIAQTFTVATAAVARTTAVTFTAKLGSAVRAASLTVVPTISAFTGKYVGASCTPALRQGNVAALQATVGSSGSVSGSFQAYSATGQSQTVPFTGTLTNTGTLSLVFSFAGISGATGTIVRNSDKSTFIGVLQEKLSTGGAGERLFIALGAAAAAVPISGSHRGSVTLASGGSLTAMTVAASGALTVAGNGIAGSGFEDALGNVYAAYSSVGVGHILIARMLKEANSIAIACSVLTNGDAAGSCHPFTGSLN